MVIYADIVFAINFFMDIFILWVVSRLAHKKIKIARLLLGGFVMAFLYCMLVFLEPMRTYLNFFSSLILIMLGNMIAFKIENPKEFLKLVIFTHISALSIGGLGIGLFYFTNVSDIMGNMVGISITNFPLKMLIISTCTFYILIKLSSNWYKRITLRKQVFYMVKVFCGKQDATFTALVDTGNSLHDPLSDTPVIIAEFNSIKIFLPDNLKLIFYENKEDNLEILSCSLKDLEENDINQRIRMIPFISLGKKNGMLIGFRPDKVEILKDEAPTTILKDVVVGIYNYKLSQDNAYQGLLNPELIHG